MQAIINNILLLLNRTGTLFWNQAAGVFFQSTILIALVFVLDLILRKHAKAVFRYCLWMLVFVKRVLPPTLCVPTGIGYWFQGLSVPESLVTELVAEPASESASTEFTTGTPHIPPVSQASSDTSPMHAFASPVEESPAEVDPVLSGASPITWQAVVFLLWLIGVLMLGALLVQRMMFVRALVAQSSPGSDELRETMNQCRDQLDVRQEVDIRLSPNIQSPVVCGLLRPVILVHASLLEKLSLGELKAVLIHELAHVKRGDLWINLMQTLLQIIYFYNPFVWLTNARVRRIREHAVDEAVLAALGSEAEHYSHTLINIANMTFWRTNLSLRLVGVAESKQALERRIRHMLTRPIPQSARISFLGISVVVLMAALLLPMAKADRTPAPEDTPSPLPTTPNNTAQPATPSNANQTHIVTFKPKAGFSPTTAKELLDAFNARHPRNTRTHHYRTEVKGNALVGHICVDTDSGRDKVLAMLKQSTKLEHVDDAIGTPTALDKLYQMGQPGLKRSQATEAQPAQPAQAQSIRLVISADKMSFEGLAVTWDELPALLEKVINPEQTTLELAVTTKKIPFDRFGTAKEQAQKLVDAHGLQSLKYVGVAKLGSKGGSDGRSQRSPSSSRRTSATSSANPKVVTSAPACMTNNVSPNTKEITVTFDQPMMDGTWSWTGGGETFPEIVGKIHYDRKKTTCTLPVKLQPGKVYQIGINSPSHKNFKNSRRMPAQRYAIVFATADEKGNPTPIPDDLHTWARRINRASAPSSASRSSSQRQGQATELAQDDGSRAGKHSFAGGGHAVRFTTSGGDSELQAIRIYGSRYGEYQAPDEDFSVWLCDNNFRELKHFSFPYALFKQRGRAKWVTLDVEPIKLPAEFILCVAFDPHSTKGIYLHHDGSSSGHSFVGTPGGELDAYDKGDWLLRALVSGSSTEASPQGDLQARIDAARAGDTVIVPKGKYTEPVVISKSLTLKGESREDCIFELTSNKPGISLGTRGRGNVTLTGVTVKWQLATSERQDTAPCAVHVKDSKALIEDCRFTPLGNYKRCPVAVQAEGFSNLTLKACEFEGFEYTIGYTGGAKGVIEDCVIRNSGHQGASVYSDSTLTVQRTIITGSRYHALRNTGGTLHVKDCLLIKNANRGMYLGNRSGKGSIANNLLIDNGTGISGFARASYTITNNVICSSGYAGIDMRDSCRLSMRKNILVGSGRKNKEDEDEGGGMCLFREGGENYNLIGANTFWQNIADLRALEKVDNSWEDTTDLKALDQTEDMIQADPLFTDPAKGDYSLKAGPAKDQGHGLTDPSVLKTLWAKWKAL